MKNILLTFLIVFLSGCSKDSSNDNFQLPPETQTGANTFGVTIKGKVYIPRTPNGNDVGSSPHAMILWGASDFSWYEIEIKDGHSAAGFNMRIHFDHLSNPPGQHILHESNLLSSYDSLPVDNIYFSIWDPAIGNYAYYGSIENQGEVNITRLTDGIISGNFRGKFARYNNPDDIIEITDGRFDINAFTLPNTYFP